MKWIIITGPSGSGKTFLAQKLSKDLHNTYIIKTDSYYRDDFFIKLLSIFMNDIYDRILSIKNREIKKTINAIYNNEKYISIYNYEFNRKKSTKLITNKLNKAKFIIVEGIFSHRIGLNYRSSINIICNQKKEICLQRRLKRDELERGRNRDEVNKRFIKSWNLFFKHLDINIDIKQAYEINPNDKISYNNLINKLKIN